MSKFREKQNLSMKVKDNLSGLFVIPCCITLSDVLYVSYKEYVGTALQELPESSHNPGGFLYNAKNSLQDFKMELGKSPHQYLSPSKTRKIVIVKDDKPKIMFHEGTLVISSGGIREILDLCGNSISRASSYLRSSVFNTCSILKIIDILYYLEESGCNAIEFPLTEKEYPEPWNPPRGIHALEKKFSDTLFLSKRYETSNFRNIILSEYLSFFDDSSAFESALHLDSSAWKKTLSGHKVFPKIIKNELLIMKRALK